MKTILIVDDEPCYRELLTEYLARELSVKVRAVATGDEAIAELTRSSFSLVITDGFRPQEDVLEFVKKLKDLVPIMVISGGGDSPLEAEKAGAAGYFSKLELPAAIAFARDILDRCQLSEIPKRLGDFSPVPIPRGLTPFDNVAFYRLVDYLNAGQLDRISTGTECLLHQAMQLIPQPDTEARYYADLDRRAYCSRVPELIDLFRSRGGSRYFESLDVAFERAPDVRQGCAWVYIRETFRITNLGSVGGWDLPQEVLRNFLFEQKLVFQLLSDYSDRDDYFKSPKRQWHATMVVPACRISEIRIRDGKPGLFWGDVKWFLRSAKGTPNLNVLGAYFRSGNKVNIVPYVVWA
jgi:CheY-like chemotaxis protein